MTPEQETAQLTRDIWNMFERSFSNIELNVLLDVAGIKWRRLTYRQKINNCLINWFHGSVPNFKELNRLTNL